MSSTYQNGNRKQSGRSSDQRSNSTSGQGSSQQTASREPRRNTGSGTNTQQGPNPTRNTERARTIIQELKSKDTQSVPTPEHQSAKKMDSGEIEDLLIQFISEKLAHAHLSAQIDNPTRQSVETMAKAWTEPAETIIDAVRRVDRQDPPTSFWEMQST